MGWRGRGGVALLVLVLAVGLVGADRAVVAGSDDGGVVASGGFSDVGGGVHKPGIDALEAEGVFAGTECGEGLFCAGDPIRRWVMAVWLVRVLDGADPAGSGFSRFSDVDPDVWWAPFVERLAELGVTSGCATGPLRFCPDGVVTRGQMATFLVRAFGLEGGEPAGFVDTGGDTHAGSIDALAAGGVTAGCATEPLRFCPVASVTRGQMATFLVRARGRSQPTPDAAPAGAATYKAVAGACGILTDDTITCWANDHLSAINGPAGTYKSLVTGGAHYCAIATDDTVTCWGRDWKGETGAPAGTYKALSAGYWHSCAITTDGTITCWGDNRDGKADPPAGAYKSLVTGDDHNCAIATDGTVTCWGDSWLGKSEAPAGTYETVVAGDEHSCAITTDGTITCWGATCWTEDGGAYCRQSNWAPAGTYETLSAGYWHSCAIAADGTITCWGNNQHGQTDAPAGTFKTVAAGYWHSCAIATDGTIACWGDNEYGQTDAPGGTYKSLGIGRLHSCAIATDGTIACWGYNEGGQANPPRTAVEVAATQALDPLDLSGRSRADFVSSDVPAFDMIDVATGDTVNLRSVVHGRTPILLWLYSPY